MVSEGDYFYPNTLVWFVLGGGDTTGAAPHGLAYYSRLIRERSPLVHIDLLPNVPHAIATTPAGAGLIRDVLVRECRPH